MIYLAIGGVVVAFALVAWLLLGGKKKPPAADAASSSRNTTARRSPRALPKKAKPASSTGDDVEGEDPDDVTRMGKVPSWNAPAVEEPPESESIQIEEEEAAEETDEQTGIHALILVTAVARTDTGRVRKHNEDSHLALDIEPVFVVADGMGGYAGGEVASKIAVDTIAQAFRKNEFPGLKRRTRHRRGNQLVRAIELANEAILAEATANPELREMGTTIAAARFSPNKRRAFIASVGDSRVYRLRKPKGTDTPKLEQLTKDHTLAAEVGIRGAMGAQLSRAVGIGKQVIVDLLATDTQLGDVFLVCSDGLTKMMNDDAIGVALAERASEDLQATADTLVRTANERGGRDNVTVILIRIDRPKL